MAESIESFVAKLQAEGVKAGKAAGEKLLTEAQQQADSIVSEARRDAEKLLADARKQAADIIAKSKVELKLAARDVALKLREAVGRAVAAILKRDTEAQFAKPDFLGKLLHEIILLYAKADIEGDSYVRINVTPEMREQLTSWAVHELAEGHANLSSASIDLRGAPSQAGFEYNVSGATVEVTVESVVDALSELISPELREALARAMSEETQ